MFLVSSTEEDDDTNYVIRWLADSLADYGVNSLWYEYEKTMKDGPAVLGINQWVESQFTSCDYVLYICTKQFVREWQRDGDVDSILVPVVWSSRHMLDGVLPHETSNDRYAVLLLGDNPQVPTTLKKFKLFAIFKVNGKTLQTKKLINFLIKQQS